MHKSWKYFCNKEEVKKEIEKIDKFLSTTQFFPERTNIFRFLETDKNNIKVIIVGMEPYSSSFNKDGEDVPIATGRSFEIANVFNWDQKFKQSSLRNILKTVYLNTYGEEKSLDEIREKIKEGICQIAQPKEWFDNLEKQGVLFLNASLTVFPYKVKSHTKQWENFMNLLIQELDRKNVIWMLWGKDAQERVLPKLKNSKAITSCHPRLANFVKENCFAKVDNIDWTGIH